MMTSTKATFNINMEKYRLRRFVDRLVDMDEVEIHDVMPSREDRNNALGFEVQRNDAPTTACLVRINSNSIRLR